MGYNSTLVVMNDDLHEIEDDAEFGKKVAQAIIQHDRYSRAGIPNDISSGHCANAATVITTHHADETSIIAVGGNYGTVIGRTWGYSHHTPEDKERILRSLAKEMGYDLRKRKN